MRKRTLTAILLSPIFLLVALYTVLISPLGGYFVNVFANAFVDDLSIERIDGGFANTLEIHNLQWQNAQWRVSLEYAYVDVTWRCLFEPRVCVNNISLNSASLSQLSTAQDSNETQVAQASAELPLPIDISYLSLENITLALQSATVIIDKLALENVTSNDTIELERLAGKGVKIALPESKEDSKTSTSQRNSAASLPTSYSLTYSAPKLPSITTPLPIYLGKLRLEDFQYVQGTQKQNVQVISLNDTRIEGAQIAVQELAVVHEKGEVTGRVTATLEDNFPLNIALNIKTPLQEQQQQLNVVASGALDELTASVDAAGPINANVKLSANVLDDRLPLQFSAKWQEQPIPTIENATLHQGELSLEGTMGNYVLRGTGAATLPDAGKVPVSLDVVLKTNNIYVNKANINALGGTLTNTGTLYLNENIAWEGKTTLDNVSAHVFSAYAPNALSGDIDSIVQYSEKGGLNMSLRDMNVSGVLQGKPLRIKGNAVYAGPSDLFVTNIDIEQDKNTIRAMAQVLNKRHLNADINIDVSDLGGLYPEITGAVTGKINATGPWKNPTAQGTLVASNITVSPSVSETVAKQGPLSGNVNLEGTFTDHNARIHVNSSDNDIAFILKGAWADNHWVGDISDATLQIVNMHWALSTPISVEMGTQPITAKIGQHCWSSRKEGELCIANVNYQEQKASWNISASSLPVGLWANELAPTLVSSPSKATLSLETIGHYSPTDPIDASFTATMSSAVWQLGESTPLSLTINSVASKGKIKQGLLTSTSLISSKEAGDVTLKLNTRPFDDRLPLDGTLNMQGLNVAPFKPLSEAIRTLTGVLDGNIALSGFADDPALNGELTISDGAIDIQDTPVTLSDWEQKVVLNDKKATLDGTFVLGGGQGALNGELDWSSMPSAAFTLKGNDFEIRQPNIRLKVSPNIDIAATSEKIDVKGNINVPWARIELKSLPKSAVSPSKDVHLRGEPQKEEPLDVVHASVMVNIDKAKTNEVKLEAFGLTASLYGGIQVNTQPALVGYGDLQILNGRYLAYGQQLVIQTGEVHFNGPIDQPLLLIKAIRDPAKTDDDVIAGIRIDGAADAPSINLFSEPSMDQQGVLSYLLTGSGPNSGTKDPNYASLLLGFGLSNTKTLTGQIGSALGIDDFSLSTNEDRLSVTGQINERLSVEYNVDVGLSNNDANSTLRRRQLPPDLALRYQLLPRLYLEAIQTTLEDQSEFALDLYYEFFLGDNRRRPKKDDDENEDE